MKSRIKVVWYSGIPARYRENTTDEKILRGLILNSSYRKKSIGFDVSPNEHWLDLGANIGAFAIYSLIRNASCICYEPDPDCYSLLVKNAIGLQCIQMAVTNLRTKTVKFHVSNRLGNHYRGSILTGTALKFKMEVPNLYCGSITDRFDGIKMDIEGSEFGILDDEILPPCNKFVMEYHTSRDDSPTNLKRRLDYLRSRFRHIHYPPEYDKKIKEGKSVKTFQDREVFCWN